ncbi:FAD-binding and (Fe-S)-binding domain-containing protein [Allostreptomyces psammosilenae]|uniref:FAD/FMN-containing dehydrogenase/Fe-S oxidoreductase n=1 Tax=Allostreptomyces psammosilenae TaxID=1892865 RepID=A0A853A029_9ACTN|nr:FAD-binding and (Fe-S)-binding domain-containing protein [Allostreptomyces psammosilenae]NYI07725.1 FAD/FMN-containing dehydrogenase/Fe-S oxidoreductase [Allostreptomyces psammosilenae]
MDRHRPGDAARLERLLRSTVRGEVRFDAATRALHTMDASNYRRVPLAVVAPRDADDVLAVLAACAETGVPVVPRGGGTSIGGQATGVGVVLDTTRHLDRVLAIDPDARTARVQPGVVLDDLRRAAAPYGLTFGPDPSTHGRCTLGGMIGNNACGAHSLAWGRTDHNVERLTVAPADGTGALLRVGALDAPGAVPSPQERAARRLADDNLALLRRALPPVPRRTSGYGLDWLLPERGRHLARALVGSEGTLAVVTEAEVRLVPLPAARALAVLGFRDDVAAAEAVPGLLPLRPLTLESLNAELAALAGRASAGRGPSGPASRAGAAAGTGTARLPEGGAWLFAETAGHSPAEAAERARELCRAAAGAGATGTAVVTDRAAAAALWRIREDAAGTATRMADGSEAWPGWEDTAVPPERLAGYLRDLGALLRRHGLRGQPYGHFGEGCIHMRIDFDLVGRAGVARFRAFSEELAGVVVAHGGSLSGEHGDGMARSELLPRMFPPEVIALFERFKAAWDPRGLLNPGVLVRPAPLDAGLRFAVLPAEPVRGAFGYPDDGGDFSAAVRRCVGVAKCRVSEPAGAAVMCPSYRVTGEERHSTRGRARLLHEMLAGDARGGGRARPPVEGDGGGQGAGAADDGPAVITSGWASPEVREALDLCLACKGCRSDCPVGVDMATYKAEFLYHHYRQPGIRRPLGHQLMGRLPRWLRLAEPLGAAAAPLARMAGQAWTAPLRARIGLAAERALPEPAGRTFLRWWRSLPVAQRRPDRTGGRPRVVLWPDTFTNAFAPEVGRAAVAVLADAGIDVVVPPGRVCCGLTRVSTGMLDEARAVMRATLDVLEPALRAGLPVVGLEPSCTAALRADVPELLARPARHVGGQAGGGTGGDAGGRIAPDPDPDADADRYAELARRLADSVLTLAEALERLAPTWRPPRLDRPVVGQTHCHQHAVLGDGAERRLRAAAGLDGELTGGCCGLAGNFGFERGHWQVSVACAEERLLPAVRQAPGDAVLLADGFSCRTQLAQLGGVRARHLAEVLADGLGRSTGGM